MKRIVLAALAVVAGLVTVYAQSSASGGSATAFPSAIEIQQRLLLATSNDGYPVTPGDVYRLTFRQSDTLITNDFLVESDYTINMKVFGIQNAAGMTFSKLKPVVEKAVSAAYPRSMPSLVIYSLGIFQVFVKGETPQSQNVVAWGLSRLSEIFEARRGPHSSLRNVIVQSRDGALKSYDLFKVFRLGIAAEDPYVRPGDTVVLTRSERRVEISGAVYEPGTYELLPDEQLRALVEVYGGGTTSGSDVSRLRIERLAGVRAKIEILTIAEGYTKGILLENGDVITIPFLTESLPVISFEGAVIQQLSGSSRSTSLSEASGSSAATGYNRIVFTFKEGQTLSDALRTIRDLLSPLADLSSATVLREGSADPIVVDLRELLEKSVSPSDLALEANDRIVIPYLRFSVFVSGAVEEPGTYPYAPGRTYHYYVTLAGGSTQDAPDKIYITDVNGKMRDHIEPIQAEDRIFLIPADVMVQGAVFAPGSFAYREGLPVSYYLNLAGGIDPERNWNRKVRHYDSLGNLREASASVMPGDRLYVPNNNLVYAFNRFAPVIVTIVGLVLTSVQIYTSLMAP